MNFKVWLLLGLLLANPKNKEEFDKKYLVEPRNITKGIQISKGFHDGPSRKELGVKVYRADTKYGRYILMDNTIVADGPNGEKVYFAFDLKTKKAINHLPDHISYDPTAPGNDKRVAVPESCIRCHEGKATK